MRRSFRSFAKINLHLQVVGRRADGYHDLLTVFQTIDLADRITLEDVPRPGVALDVLPRSSELASGPSNLAWRAARAYLDAYPDAVAAAGVRGLELTLEKRIPMGAGLGGGSSNAAAVLLALRDRVGVPAEAADLAPLARRLGADVPFFLHGGTALGTARGDEIQPWPDLGPEQEILLAVPGTPLATAEVFGRLERERIEPRQPPAALAEAADGRWAGASLAEFPGWNDLEPAALALRPDLADMYARLTEAGAQVVRMTGSGSCFVGFLPPVEASPEGRREPADPRILRVRTLSRASYRIGRRLPESAPGSGRAAGGERGDHGGQGLPGP